MRSRFPVVMVISSVLLVACSSAEERASDELSEIEAQLEDLAQGGDPEPVYLDLDLDQVNRVDFENGVSYTFAGFERGVSTWADETIPYLGFDVTLINNSGASVEPYGGVNLWYTYGDAGTEASPVVDAENGIGVEEEYSAEYPEFGATVSDGDEVTLRFGYALPEDETRFEIRLQPWDIEGEGDVYLTGEIPQG